MSIDTRKIHRALEILGVGEHSIIGHTIENEADFYLKFYSNLFNYIHLLNFY